MFLEFLEHHFLHLLSFRKWPESCPEANMGLGIEPGSGHGFDRGKMRFKKEKRGSRTFESDH